MDTTRDGPDGERRSVPLVSYDFSADGVYFVTVSTQHRVCLFGDVDRRVMQLNDIGEIVAATWRDTVHHFSNLILDDWVVMPNHVHGIVVLEGAPALRRDAAGAACQAPYPMGDGGEPRAQLRAPARGSLGVIIGSFKSAATRRINLRRNTPEGSVWYRGYHDRVIDCAAMLADMRRYIAANPRRWIARDSRWRPP